MKNCQHYTACQIGLRTGNCAGCPSPAPPSHCVHWTATGPKTGSCAALGRAVHRSACSACSKKSPPPGVGMTISAAPRKASAPVAVAPKANSGPGTELKKLLKRIGITSSPTCACNAHARKMDEWGPQKCEANLSVIVGWLREEAAKRKLPFVEFAAMQLVRLAIRRAEAEKDKKEWPVSKARQTERRI